MKKRKCLHLQSAPDKHQLQKSILDKINVSVTPVSIVILVAMTKPVQIGEKLNDKGHEAYRK